MGIVCWDVHKKVQAFKREHQGVEGGGRSLSTKVFWQSTYWVSMTFHSFSTLNLILALNPSYVNRLLVLDVSFVIESWFDCSVVLCMSLNRSPLILLISFCFVLNRGFYMTWPPYLALQFLWSAGNSYTNYDFILYAGTVVPLQGMWNCFNYARTRQLKHARELFSSFISSLGASVRRRQLPIGGFTEHETRYTSTGGPTLMEPPQTVRSLLEDYDDELLTYFTGSSMQSIGNIENDPEKWVTSNDMLPILSSFYPVLHSSVTIPNGSALLISERVKQVLRSRSIAAVYSSGAKADCITKQNVNFRIRLYRKSMNERDTIILEIQRREGFDVMFQKDVFAIFDAAEGNVVDPTFDEPAPSYQDGADDNMDSYTQSSLRCISNILCPDIGEAMIGDANIALPVLISLTNMDESGQTAVVVSRDLLCNEVFARLREKIISYSCSINEDSPSLPQYNRVKLLSLEILANVTSCLQGGSEGSDLMFDQSLLLHLISLVEEAATSPREADLACLILKHTTESQSLDDEQNARLSAALVNANSYGNKMHADLEVHSRECSSLMYGLVA